jgi:hypothetical protein
MVNLHGSLSHLSIGMRSASASVWVVDVILAGQECDQASTSLMNIELCHILELKIGVVCDARLCRDATVFNNDGVTSVTVLLR